MTSTAVRVALRVRPLTQKEAASNCAECISFIPNQPQIAIGRDYSFTYDYVFDPQARQEHVYQESVVPLLEKFVDGFNATILAYGQTGSGKTFSMGTAWDGNPDSEHQGIIPRFIKHMFEKLDEKQQQSPHFEYQVYASFLELYNEDMIDLLNLQPTHRRTGGNHAGDISIREDVQGNIYWTGVREERCMSPDELLCHLTRGANGRTTAATDMNSVSSRSHAIFSVQLKQTMTVDDEGGNDKKRPVVEGAETRRTITSKFHFVDLAGSERLKRTNAQGERAREGIAINSGLLALGNVISALGDESRRSTHVPYRDSKLTRLLQDSLGGNSQTVMMACVSPSDSNFIETLSTLKYANRARNIKNRVSVNQEYAGASAEANQLRSLVTRLKAEINQLRSGQQSGGLPASTAVDAHEMQQLHAQVSRLRARLEGVSDELCKVTAERDTMRMELEFSQLSESDWPQVREQLSHLPDSSAAIPTKQDTSKTLPIIAHYQRTIQDLKTELADAQERAAYIQSAQNAMKQPGPKMVTSKSKQTSSRIRGHRTRSRNTSTATRRVVRSPQKNRMHRTSTKQRRNIPDREVLDPVQPASLPKVHDDSNQTPNDDIENWLKGTMDSHLVTTDIRGEARESIEKARAEIQQFLKDMEDTKAKATEKQDQDTVQYGCDLLNDDELFEKLADSDNALLFANLEQEDSDSTEDRFSAWSKTNENSTLGGRSRFTSYDTVGSSEDANSHLLRMVQQVQSDIRVKEDLVDQLERCETDYHHMKQKFSEKLHSLGHEITKLRGEREHLLRRSSYTQSKELQAQREKQLNDVRLAQETKMKSLLSQLSYVRRKYAQTTSSIQSSRNQNESMLRALRVNVESLKVEKRRMVKRMKDDAERVKEQMLAHGREIQQLQRKQARETEGKRRLEREHRQALMVLQKRTDDATVSGEKLKQLVAILKKAVREGGVLDERLLAKCKGILDLGGVLAARPSSRINRRSLAKEQRLSAEARVAKKKALLDRTLTQLIQSRQAVLEMKQLVNKRNKLVTEKQDILAEWQALSQKEVGEDDVADPAAPVIRQFMKERLDTIVAEVSYLNARIQSVQADAAHEMLQDEEEEEVVFEDHAQRRRAPRAEKRVTFADQVISTASKVSVAQSDEWLDMDAMEEQFTLSSNADPDALQDMILQLFASLEPDESTRLLHTLTEDLVALRMGEYGRQGIIQQLEKRVHDLQTTLIVMRKAAVDATVQGEKKIRRLEGTKRLSGSFEDFNDDVDSAIDLRTDEQCQHAGAIFDKIYNDGLRGVIMSPTWSEYHQRQHSPSSSATLLEDTGARARPSPPQSLTGKSGSGTGPIKPSLSPLDGRRGSLSSPEQFLQDLMQNTRPAAPPLMKPAEFSRYQAERESSTSSILSRHMRRSSVQSDTVSWSSWGSQPSVGVNAKGLADSGRPRAHSLQRPPRQQRRSLLRELTLDTTSHAETMAVLSSPNQPLGSSSSLFAAALQRAESRQASPTDPAKNVFDRLATGHTQASQAKRSPSSAGHRHSSTSYDEIRRRWELNASDP